MFVDKARSLPYNGAPEGESFRKALLLTNIRLGWGWLSRTNVNHGHNFLITFGTGVIFTTIHFLYNL
jgi:hypothetical protein